MRNGTLNTTIIHVSSGRRRRGRNRFDIYVRRGRSDRDTIVQAIASTVESSASDGQIYVIKLIAVDKGNYSIEADDKRL